MRTLVLGAKGQLGRDLMEVFGKKGEIWGADLPEVDIADGVALAALADRLGPDLIINAAAYTDVDGAEENVETAFRVNETGARNAADVAAYHDIPVVYYSTDYVFDGAKGLPYVPSDPMAPINMYGRSKAAGEAATRKSALKCFIIRTAWLYGPGGSNFVEKILRAAETKPELRVVEDEIGSPTHTLDLAEATLALVQTQSYGLYHAVNEGSCSRYEQARAIIEYTGLKNTVVPCSLNEFPTKAQRPVYSVLDSSAVAEASGYVLRGWREALQNYIQRRAEAL